MSIICKSLLTFILLSKIFLGLSNSVALANNNFSKVALPKGSMMRANKVYYDEDEDSITATGNIFIQIDEYSIRADKIHYNVAKDILLAEGEINIVDNNGKQIHGNRAVFKDKLKHGIIADFIIRFDKNTILASKLAKRLNENQLELKNAVFTPCTIQCGNNPIWQIKAEHTDIDYDKKQIAYKNLFFEVYGVPIIYLPYFAHPTPNSPAKSGILAPKIKKDSFMVPFYFRAQPNLDITISPRIAKNYTITEAQLRHKISSGEYQINGSIGNPKFNNDTNNKKSSTRYQISTKGDFFKNNIYYGFDINRASDKAYLANHNSIYSSYLTSEIYANQINNRNYFSLEGLHFQDLRVDKNKKSVPLIWPSIRTQNIYELNDDQSLLLNVNTNHIVYSQVKEKQLYRSSARAELMSNIISNNGHVFTFSLSNQMDLYWIKLSDYNNTKESKEKKFTRNIPQLTNKWSYPLIGSMGSKSSIKIEPTAMLVIGQKYETRFNKHELIDSSKNELSENNIFSPNRFGGIDYHEYGNRLSYGINTSLSSNYLYIDTFLGQLVHKHNQLVHKHNVEKKNNSEYVGNIRVDIASNFGAFYRFRKDKFLKPIRNELGVNFNSEDIKANATFAELHRVSHYFAKDDQELRSNNASQLGFDVKYQLKKDLWVGFSSRLDLSFKKTRTLVRTIEVTYLYDCVSIGASITDNFLHDSSRGVKKDRSKSLSIGLKVINL